MKNILCYIFGHKYYKVTEHDNGYSRWGYHACSRCPKTREYQFDYKITLGIMAYKVKEYTCTDCKKVSKKKDNGKITVGLCDYCKHPLWN